MKLLQSTFVIKAIPASNDALAETQIPEKKIGIYLDTGIHFGEDYRYYGYGGRAMYAAIPYFGLRFQYEPVFHIHSEPVGIAAEFNTTYLL
jgi:hypothetical protein